MSDFLAFSTCNYISLFLRMELKIIAQLQKIEARIFSLDARKTEHLAETARKTLVDVWRSIDPNPFSGINSRRQEQFIKSYTCILLLLSLCRNKKNEEVGSIRIQ